ncbi:MAG: translocation/assembly module TamB domain-containing protein, partial [Candidatus Binatia bacterium]
RLRGQASSVGGKLHVEAEAESLPLGLVSAFAPQLDVQGEVSGRLVLDGAARDTATGEMTLKGRGVSGVGLDPELSTPVDVDATLRLKGGRLAGTAGLAGLAGTTLALTLDAPMSRTAGGAPLSATLVWKGDLAPVVGLLPLGEDQVSGRIDADLRATGTMAAPRITGRASIEGGTWDQAATGLALRDLRAELRGSGTSLELDSLTAGDGNGGTVQGRGRLDFTDLPGFVVELDLEANDALLARLDLLTMKADATVAIRASRGKEKDEAVVGSVTGSVRIDDARVEIPTRFVSGIPEIVVVEVGAVGDAELARAEHRAALDLDLSVKGDNRIFVSGRGVESEWASDLHLRGDTLDPRIEGTVTSVRGQLSLLGRRFDIDSATLRFDGSEGNVPYLTMKARAEAHDITAIAEVTGPATSPVIELRSDPALPRDEVLSRVLFGQSAANLTPMQSVQLARGVAELAGSPLGGSGSGFLGGIGRTLGLDRLDIESAGSDGAAALTASKYLTDNVYLRVQGGLTPESSKLSLEWRIFKHITIESDVSQDAQGEVGATWRWDY